MESKNTTTQEIDLSYISKKTSDFFDSIGFLLYKFFKFCIKNILILLVLLAIGIGVGYYLDNFREETYKHEVIVVPNFNSTSYLYNSIKNKDFKDSNISKATIEPVVDIYTFIQERYQNLEIAKYLSENNIKLEKFDEGNDVEKFYRYHKLTVYTKGKDENGENLQALLDELNSDPYYLSRQKVEKATMDTMILEITKSVASVNNILNKLGTPGTGSGDLNIEMYSELNNLINSKKGSIEELGRLKVYQLEQTKVIYDSARVLNIKDKSFPKMIVLPILLLGLFFGFSVVMSWFKKYSQRTA